MESISTTHGTNAAQKKPTESDHGEPHSTVCTGAAIHIHVLGDASATSPRALCATPQQRGSIVGLKAGRKQRHHAPERRFLPLPACGNSSLTSRPAPASAQHEVLGHEPAHSEASLGTLAEQPVSSAATASCSMPPQQHPHLRQPPSPSASRWWHAEWWETSTRTKKGEPAAPWPQPPLGQNEPPKAPLGKFTFWLFHFLRNRANIPHRASTSGDGAPASGRQACRHADLAILG